jgi:hypothetical protein
VVVETVEAQALPQELRELLTLEAEVVVHQMYPMLQD